MVNSRSADLNRMENFPFDSLPERSTSRFHLGGGGDKSLGKIDPQHRFTVPSQFKAGTANRATYVQGARSAGQSQKLIHQAGRKIQRLPRTWTMAKDLLRRSVMKKQVFADELFGLVGIHYWARSELM